MHCALGFVRKSFRSGLLGLYILLVVVGICGQSWELTSGRQITTCSATGGREITTSSANDGLVAGASGLRLPSRTEQPEDGPT